MAFVKFYIAPKNYPRWRPYFPAGLACTAGCSPGSSSFCFIFSPAAVQPPLQRKMTSSMPPCWRPLPYAYATEAAHAQVRLVFYNIPPRSEGTKTPHSRVTAPKKAVKLPEPPQAGFWQRLRLFFSKKTSYWQG